MHGQLSLERKGLSWSGIFKWVVFAGSQYLTNLKAVL